MPLPHIRPARWADLTALKDMITALAIRHGDVATIETVTLNRNILDDDPWLRVSVAEIGEEIVGYVALCPLMQLQWCERGMDLHHIYVTEAHRGCGVGRALIENAIARARALGCVYLMVGTKPDNLEAQAAYKACGFTSLVHNPTRFRMAI